MLANQVSGNEIIYRNFKIRYGMDDANIAENVLNILTAAIPQYEAFFGISLDRQITIYLPSSLLEIDPWVFGQLPDWSNGVFVQDRNQIILKKPQWYSTDQNFTQVLRHELSHAYFRQKFGQINTPLWFNEGIAEYLSGSRLDISNGLKLSNAMFSHSLISLAHIDSLMEFSWSRAQLAYIQSLSAVIFLEKQLRERNTDFLAFMDSVRSEGFDKALKMSLGIDIIDFEIKWYRWLDENYKWFIVFNWENLIWVIMIIVMAGALYAVRYRNRKIMLRWEKEEQEKSDDQLTETIES